MSTLPDLEQFQLLVGQGFRLDYPDYQETLTLVSATALKFDPPPGLPRGFDLIFEGENPSTMLGQSIYALDHPVLGRVELFLVCIGPLPGGRFRYQAIIN